MTDDQSTPTSSSAGTSTTAPSTPTARPRSRARGAVAAVMLAGLVAGGVSWGAWGQPAAAEPAGQVQTGRPNPAVQAEVDAVVEDLEFPAALAHVVDERGRERDYTAGVGDLATGAKVPADGQVRIGSNTKTFTATVVLQLVGEGRVDLEAPVETYLPGLVRGEGIDGNQITVRDLLQHTSGLPAYTNFMNPDPFAQRDVYTQERDLTDLAFAHPAEFAPGTQWNYSNTNYTVLGMLIEKVTGRPYAEQVTERIIEPLGLERTYVPGPGERELRDTHPRGYHPQDGELTDITALDPSWGGAAGEMVSTPSELNEFFTALLGGELLEPAELAAMQTTVPMPEEYPGDGYGLGLISTETSCGEVLWGHGGDIFGYSTRGGVTEDGTAVALAVTSLPVGLDGGQDLDRLYGLEESVDAIVCAS